MPLDKEMVAGPLRSPDGEDLFTTTQVAEALGLSRSTIGTLIHAGTLRAVWLDERTALIRRSELERYREESLGRPGRKAKSREG
jgi:excisionase family DNA binding protein